MDKKTFQVILIAILFIMSYQYILGRMYPEYGKHLKERQALKSPAAQTATSAAGKSELSPVSKVSPMLRAEDYLPKDDVIIPTDCLRLVFNKKGGAIRQIDFLKYTNSETKQPIQFYSSKDSKATPTGIGFILPEGAPAQPLLELSAQGSSSLAFSGGILDGKLLITKEYLFDPKGYSGKLVLTFQNRSDAPLNLQYELFAGSRILPRHSIDQQYIEANFFQKKDGKNFLRHITESRLGKEVSSGGPVQWCAIKDRHFSIILKPQKEDSFTALVRGLGDRHLSVSLVSPMSVLAPAGVVRQEFVFYIGPNDIDQLVGTGLSDIINFGRFSLMDMIARLLLGGLELLNKIFHNYGAAIIVLTVLINILLFPLTRASFVSMKRMQLIQPQMTKLREQHKKNPEKLNKEMMELYRKHKVNPFGGCLPMLLQMPFFISLYVALSKTSALINARFLWVTDLSSPDRVLLPFALPFLGSEIHVLPLIMVALMVVQQRFMQISVDTQDPAMKQQQQMMTVMMPIIFGFIFYTMPSGLVLYWLTNTVLQAAYQFYLRKVTIS